MSTHIVALSTAHRASAGDAQPLTPARPRRITALVAKSSTASGPVVRAGMPPSMTNHGLAPLYLLLPHEYVFPLRRLGLQIGRSDVGL